MGMLDSIAQRFGAGVPKPQAQQPANQGGNFKPDNNQSNMQFQPSGQSGSADQQQGGATIPGQTQSNDGSQGAPNAQQQQKSTDPFDRFGKMFDNSQKPEVAPGFAIDDKMLDDVASKQDPFAGIDADLLARADAGDSKAAREVMTMAMRNMYKTTVKHNGILGEKFVGAREEFQGKSFGKKVKSELTANSMADHPAMKSPVVKKQMNEAAQRFADAHPDMSPQEIKDMTVDYFKQLGALFNPQADGGAGGKSEPEDADFDQWFGSGTVQTDDKGANFF